MNTASAADRERAEAIALHRAGRVEDALAAYDRALGLGCRDAEFLAARGMALAQLGRLEPALVGLDDALAAQPGNRDTLVNRGIVLAALGRLEEALASHDRALALGGPSFVALYNRATTLHRLGRFEAALADLDRALTLAPDVAAAHNNRGAALERLNRAEEALGAFERALALDPRNADAWSNRGNALRALDRLEPAVASYDRAVALDPRHAEAWSNRAIALSALRRPAEAAASFDRALTLKPDLPLAAGLRLHCKMLLADWRDFAAERDAVTRQALSGAALVDPFILLTISDDPTVHLAAARTYAAANAKDSVTGMAVPSSRKERIRIGYYSADFHAHPTMFLIADVLEAHDRERFEFFAFSFGPDRADPWRRRAERAVERFIDVRFDSDRAVAALGREVGLDIAVDLKGFTKDNRIGIFAARAAPLQVGFLGYPGTMGANFIDYIVADPVVAPHGERRHYAEKVVTLPDCYQPNRAALPALPDPPTRAEIALPSGSFVLCCFNRVYKITPEMFDVWMAILRAAPNAVLWLWADEPVACANLRREAHARGVDADRLIFAPQASPEQHLSRLRLADLFLDTLPYNAHTSGGDALRMGVPIVTNQGSAFAARVAASLLRAVGLGQLVARSLTDYQKTAIRLATDPAAHAEVRRALEAALPTSTLFQPRRFAANLERAFEAMHRRRLEGLPPDHIDL